MKRIIDDRGYSQGWKDSDSTRIRASRRCDQMLSAMDRTREISILEIGCGLGSNAHQLAVRSGQSVLATDLCEPFIQHARETYPHPRLRFEVLDFNHAEDFRNETFDYIVGNGILHHLYHELDPALTQLRRLLSPGGRLIFFEPNLYNPYVFLIFTFQPLRRMAQLEPAEMAFSKPFIQERLRRAGFADINVEFRDFLLPGIPMSLVRPSIAAGAVLEKIPLLRTLSQSLFITASNPQATR